MLFLIATPIGNLADMTYRAVRVLGEVDIILCEDTRHSGRLLQHYGVSKPLKSFHQHNEAQRTKEVLEWLQNSKQVALIVDAGTPGICDPGQRLVARCRQASLEVTAVPGACAAIDALSLSGFPNDRFRFVGFLPRKASAKKDVLLAAVLEGDTTIAYESPERILATLSMLHEIQAGAQVGVARELTKQFEAFVWGTPAEVATRLTVRGEMVLLIQGRPAECPDWLQLSASEHVQHLMTTYGLTQMDAIKLASKQRGIPKGDIYSKVHQKR